MNAVRILVTLIAVASLFAENRLLAAADKPAATLTGKVIFQGKPVAAGKIALHPKVGKPVAAEVKDGNYRFKSVPVGEMTVTIAGKLLPKKYASPRTSRLKITVAKGANSATFELK